MDYQEKLRKKEEQKENRKSGMMIFLGVIVLIIFLFAVGFGTTYGKLQMDKFFKPKFKEVERDVWEETPSRVLGAQQEIAKRQLEWKRTDSQDEKDAICAYLRNSYPDLSQDKFNDQVLWNFFKMCKYGG